MFMPPLVIMIVTIAPVIVMIALCVVPSRRFALPVMQALFCLWVEFLFVCEILS
jgi:hypothetical protein